jgi:hypothetical protein
MKYDPDIHHHRSIRLKGYDYSRAGAYFVTICAQNRECLFGEILDGEMALNDAGRMIETIWHELPEHYPGIGIDAFQVMPNHMHGIVIVRAGTGACPYEGRTMADITEDTLEQTALKNINPNISPHVIRKAVRKITRTASPGLIENNRRFHSTVQIFSEP